MTIRTLHHYDEIGLVSPGERSQNGHRLYTLRDVTRLHAVRILQQIGIPLGEIRRILNRKDFSLPELNRIYILLLVKRIKAEGGLSEQLKRMRGIWQSGNEVQLDGVIKCISAMSELQRCELRIAND
jgi:MerR family transcriptional regulator, thiopeptide resistance regulator